MQTTQVTITATPTTLTQAGQTTKLKVMGKYTDGSNKDVTAKSTGTQYLISNPTLATVSDDGLVTAKQSGTVVIQAIQEGAQGLLQINIALSKDSDGDGLLDDVELREGLDPNNPADALDDPDRDGLTNKVVNIAKLTLPVKLGAAAGGDVRDVAVSGTYAFLADYSRSFTVVDITKPATPVMGASLPRTLTPPIILPILVWTREL